MAIKISVFIFLVCVLIIGSRTSVVCINSNHDHKVKTEEKKKMNDRYLFKLAGFDNRGVAVLVISQAEQDVVTNGPWHEPRSLR